MQNPWSYKGIQLEQAVSGSLLRFCHHVTILVILNLQRQDFVMMR